jgi:SpoVK/Ycf46/Vps4 family AAA+-type ATPase
MVKTLFAVAVYREPSVVFIDEVDSLLCQRSEGENEATRRMKTEIFIQLDGANTNADARVILIGATNRPDELDEAARRRFQKRIYIPLPDEDGRRQLFDTQLDSNPHSLYLDDINELVELTKGYSGADIRLLLTEAAMGPMREMAKKFGNNVTSIREADIPQINRNHFDDALENVAPSVSQADLQKYIEWNSIYGSSNRKQGGATSN